MHPRKTLVASLIAACVIGATIPVPTMAHDLVRCTETVRDSHHGKVIEVRCTPPKKSHYIWGPGNRPLGRFTHGQIESIFGPELLKGSVEGTEIPRADRGASLGERILDFLLPAAHADSSRESNAYSSRKRNAWDACRYRLRKQTPFKLKACRKVLAPMDCAALRVETEATVRAVAIGAGTKILPRTLGGWWGGFYREWLTGYEVARGCVAGPSHHSP